MQSLLIATLPHRNILGQSGHQIELPDRYFVDGSHTVVYEVTRNQNGQGEDLGIMAGVTVCGVRALGVYEEQVTVLFGVVQRFAPHPNALRAGCG